MFSSNLRTLLLRLTLIALLPVMPLAAAESWIINEEVPPASPLKNSPDAESASKKLQMIESADILASKDQADLDRLLSQAWRELESKVSKHWSEVLVSDANRWVSYSEDWQVRKVVDFEANEIAITLPANLSQSQRIDFQATSAQVTQYVFELLNTSLREAIQQDSLFAQTFSKLNLNYSPKMDALVLSELFTQDNPSERAIRRRAQRLMQDAEIGFYQQQASVGRTVVSLEKSKRLTYRMGLPNDRVMKKAKQFRPSIMQASKQMQVPADLVFAIVHAESHFNPLARSPIPAYGLMQIVPQTAGRDATKLLFDQALNLSPTYLYDPDNNIEVGVAYIKLLYSHYLKEIDDPLSRLYCTIAAYNTGPVNVARAFGPEPSLQLATPTINDLSPQQVLASLLSSLPSQETRDYLKKVLALKSLYARV